MSAGICSSRQSSCTSGTKRDTDSICQLVYASLHLFAGILVEEDIFAFGTYSLNGSRQFSTKLLTVSGRRDEQHAVMAAHTVLDLDLLDEA